MVDEKRLELLKNDIAKWNEWRDENRNVEVALSGANLSGANLSGADLRSATLRGADLRGAGLSDANLMYANLSGANLGGADLSSATLGRTDFSSATLRDADLSGARLFGANLSGANIFGANLGGANLTDADLSSATLRRTDLRSATLRRTDLSSADLNDANLSGADLRDANLSGADLSDANLSGADLKMATFRSSYAHADGATDSRTDEEQKREARPPRVSGASFIGADLTDANWMDADLTDTRLQDAILKNADLTGVTSLLAEQLAGADVTNAKLPTNLDEEFEKPLAVIEKAVGYARKIYLTMLLGCAYSLLTIFTTDDIALITNSASSQLPIIGATVPIMGYYLLAPLILIGFYLYFHISMQRIWENAARLPAVLPDGRSLDRVVDPWLLTGLLRAHLYRLRPKIKGDSRRARSISWFKAERAYLGSLQNGLSIALAWGVVPFTVSWMGYDYLTAHDLWPTLFHSGVIAAASTFGLWSYSMARRTLRGTIVARSLSRIAFRSIAGVMVILVVFCVTSVLGLRAAGLICTLSERLEWELTECRDPYDPTTMVWRHWIVADLVEKQISKMPANYHELKIAAEVLKRDIEQSDSSTSDVSSGGIPSVLMEAIQGANLRNRDLRGAQARRGFFARADLRRADLRGADLSGADLSDANLNSADLRGANLRNANLRNADLRGANLRNANLRNANLFLAELNCWALRIGRNWETTYRSHVLACGALIPDPPEEE